MFLMTGAICLTVTPIPFNIIVMLPHSRFVSRQQ